MALRIGVVPPRHPRAGGDPATAAQRDADWIPAFAGMTAIASEVIELKPGAPIDPSAIDLLVLCGLPPADAGALMASLPPTLPVLWLHGEPAPLEPIAAHAIAPLADPLTPRELEVFELLAKGLANREIAAVLGVSRHTAKFHVAQILEKTGAATRTEAVRLGLRLGLIGL